jgi:signal transduction histidine kinase
MCLQQSQAGNAPSLVAGLTVVTAALALAAERWTPSWRIVSLVASGLFLVAATSSTSSGSPNGFALVRAAGPLAVVTAAASVLPLRLVWTIVVGGCAAGVAHLAFFDPFFDPRCEACGRADIAVWANADGARWLWAIGWLIIVAGVVLDARWHPWFAGVTVLAAVVYAAQPHRSAVLMVPVGAASVEWLQRTVRSRRRSARLRQLLAAYEVSNTDLTMSMRHAYADPTLSLAYPVDARHDASAAASFVDSHGEPSPVGGQKVTEIWSSGELLACVSHHVDLPDRGSALLEPVAALTMYRERTTAQLAARVRGMAEQRRAIASAGLTTRAVLERDLHDGVQQELLALGLDIRLAIATRPTDDLSCTDGLQRALVLVHDCVDQVRAISTGVAPPMLATHGVRAAIDALARRRGIVIDSSGIELPRCAPDVELAAFAALSDAFVSGSSDLRATIEAGQLRLVATTPVPMPHPSVDWAFAGSLSDLFEALGGTLCADGQRWEGVLPCGS